MDKIVAQIVWVALVMQPVRYTPGPIMCWEDFRLNHELLNFVFGVS